MENIEFKEIVELFLCTSFRQIKSESEVPNVNFQFEEDAILLFENIVENPFVKKGSWTPDARREDIDFILDRNNDDCLTIKIRDVFKFFKYLMDITNESIKLNNFYGKMSLARNQAMQIMRRIWLRMAIEDIENVELFLEKQLQFVKNRTFDTRNLKKISSFYGYNVFMKTIVNQTWDETTRSMVFAIIDNDETYELPHILYDIDDQGICYIYGVQTAKTKKSKIIERKLYKLNKNINNPNVHPSKVYALTLFIEQLKQKGISKIIVPGLQVLSYRYHELLSKEAKNSLDEAKIQLTKDPNEEYFREKYEAIKEWYDKVYEKQDKISYLKTEELFNLIYRIIEQESNIEIINEINIQGDSLNIRIK